MHWSRGENTQSKDDVNIPITLSLMIPSAVSAADILAGLMGVLVKNRRRKLMMGNFVGCVRGWVDGGIYMDGGML